MSQTMGLDSSNFKGVEELVLSEDEDEGPEEVPYRFEKEKKSDK